MKKKVRKLSLSWILALVGIGLILLIIFFFLLLNNFEVGGNVALISIDGVITVNGGGSLLGQEMVTSDTIVKFLKEAEESALVEAVVLEINSPGGSAVASDEIAKQIKKMDKPVVAVIREVGASGGYWVASATDHVIANRMSITGSIGVISSYLEFEGLMEKYGVGYERLVGGKYKDMGTPFRSLSEEERSLLQGKIDKIHDFFIAEIAANRGLSEEEVRKAATGEFYLGIEAYELGLVDELGDRDNAEKYLQEVTGLEEINYVRYEKKKTFFEELMGVVSEYFFKLGEGMGSVLVRENNLILV